MKRAEAVVLAVLYPGGVLSAAQIRRDAVISRWTARRVLARLEACGLVVSWWRRGRWQISRQGRAVLAANVGRLA